MIIASLIGGLGNQLFQYALAKKLAVKYNTDVYLDISGFEEYKLHKFSMQQFAFEKRIATTQELMLFKEESKGANLFNKLNKKFLNPVVIREKQFNYDPDVFQIARKNTYLYGYWQTERYFSDVRNNLLNDLKVTKPIEGKNRQVANLISGMNAVSLHIRRADYVSNNDTLKVHGICGLDYYEQALEYISANESNVTLFVFSDDIPWCRKHLKTSLQIYFVDHNNADTNYEDMRLMSLCKHNIIANSSFSWWGAWLNTNEEKIVIGPKEWFQTMERDYSDVIPGKWIRI
ncbi:MAG: alpha-1,2-fucosyltransferase [Ginsengibacter sp.]